LRIDRNLQRGERGAQIAAASLERQGGGTLFQFLIEAGHDVVERRGRVFDAGIFGRAAKHAAALSSDDGGELQHAYEADSDLDAH
jgi:hypothetical protein